jgi:ABC-type sugar transport system substrate-binding protein
MSRSNTAFRFALAVACALAPAATLTGVASASEAPPPPPVQYPYYTLPSVSVEVHGSYSEHYEAPMTHDTEDVDFHFDLSRSYSDVEGGRARRRRAPAASSASR